LITAHKTAGHKRLLQKIKKYKQNIFVTFFRGSVGAEEQTLGKKLAVTKNCHARVRNLEEKKRNDYRQRRLRLRNN
jgi:hypothetical protein